MDQNEQILEFPKILDRLSGLAANSITREMALQVQPTSDLAEAQRELQKTQDAMQLSFQFGSPPFFEFRDMRNLLYRAKSGAVLSQKDLMDVATVLRQIQSLVDWYDHCAGVETVLDDWFMRLTPVPYLLEKLERSIVSEEEIADAASPALTDIRKKLARARQKSRDAMDNMVRNQSIQEYLQDTRATIRDGRLCLPVKVEHRGKVPGLVHDTSSTGQTVFIEPIAVVDANNEIRLLELQEAEEIQRILEELSHDCGTWADSIIADHQRVAELNLYFAKARMAEQMHAFPPVLTDDGVIDLRNARHPLLPYESAVPISFTLGKDFQALIITGPNTGGKTVALKTCGLLTLMAMSGMMIPAAEGSRVSVFRRVLADIGDTQSIEQNLSTFSAHMKTVIQFTQEADDSTLVLLDELGSGTDPIEGAALAEAIVDRLKAQGAKLMVTTHYQELKLYATQEPDVENASCEFDIVQMKPTFRLILGSPGKSNAFAICAGLGMDEDIIDEAKTLVTGENRRFEEAIDQLDATRKALEEEKTEVDTELATVQADKEDLEARLARAEQDRVNTLEQAKRDASQIVESTKAQSNAILTELEQLRKEKDKASFSEDVTRAKSHVKQSYRNMYETANPDLNIPDDEYQLPRALQVGDTVQLHDTGQTATVLSEPDKNGKVFVQIGAMRSKVAIETLRLVQRKDNAQKSKAKAKKPAVTTKADRQGSMELDIRGETCDEGVYLMESFLDQAVMSHIHTVTIIHGKGTGQLRKAVHQRLKQLPYVDSFRLGTYGEGEDGVTIVTLK